MKFLTNEVRRGPKRLLKHVIIEENNKIISQRDQMEQAIINKNIRYHKVVFNTKVYKDRIYKKLLNNEIRDDILKRKLDEFECTNRDVYKFLTLLQ